MEENICKKCGTHNVLDAKFCKNCGQRLDGKKVCIHCGKLIDDDAIYCSYCGGNINATKEEFKKPEVTKKKTSINYKPALKLSSFILSCVVAALIFLMTFLIGFSAKSSQSTVSSDIFIYYFLGEIYTSNFTGTNIYSIVGPILATLTVVLIFVGIIIGVAFFIKNLVNYFNGKVDSITKSGLIIYLIYIAGVSLLHLLVASNSIVTSQTESIVAGYYLNAPTMLGIILGAILIIASLVLDAIRTFRLNNLKGYLKRAIPSLFIIVLGIISFSLISQNLTELNGYNSSYHESISVSYGIINFISYMTIYMFQVVPGGSEATSFESTTMLNYGLGVAFSCLIFLCFILFALFFILGIKEVATKFGQKSKNASKYLITSSAFIVTIGVFEFALNATAGVYFFNTTISPNGPIFILIVGLFALASAIVYAVLNKSDNEEKIVVIEQQ